MNDEAKKREIQSAIQAFATQPLYQAGMGLLDTLGYRSDLTLRVSGLQAFRDTLDQQGRFQEKAARVEEWKGIEFLRQITGDDLDRQGQSSFFQTEYRPTEIQSYIFLAIELQQDHYTRTELAQITRAVNRVFAMPAMLLFKHGTTLTFSIINRRPHQRDESKDVLEKVTLIKDISCSLPHRAHLEILFDLSKDELHRKHGFSNFEQLHSAWQKTLDTKELNKKFYRELANWYFWALGHVTFSSDAPKDDGRDSVSVIRLITRLIFCWFLKEKGLIPEPLFNPRQLSNLLKDFSSGEGTYYKAILQNLFFATLNQEMGLDKDGQPKRRFRKDGQNFMVHNLYRYRRLFKDPDAALQLFTEIPFMNGGLFECLDKNIGTKEKPQYQRFDGFSDREDNPLKVPNELFFGKEQKVDLNAIYGDNKHRNAEVRGLICLLERYKFTVTENTPIEEEVALDPELLGKVFENLLAAYNPETGATARKQTGSYYTPREIVNYMVDESLKAYLKQNLETEAGMKPEDAEVGLEFLIGYYDKENLFDEKQTEVLINAIDRCKVLDPACGSGAFPMGMLHKLVFVLGKLDPHNQRWKELQLSKAYEIPDVTVRENTLADIERAFQKNELDYGRKLFLIENCIYGVDIQPIAVQIAKLRFFISLLVDQKVDRKDDNLGIIPLPNLETKFVAANTLIGIERPKKHVQTTLRNPEIIAKEERLHEVRDRHFNARTPATKAKYREEDAKLRAEIAELLKTEGYRLDTAEMLAGWDPYDQNAHADFFDVEWMFGLFTTEKPQATISGNLGLVNEAAGQMEFSASTSKPTGFDVIIANPPYVRADSGPEYLSFRKKLEESKAYKTLYEKWDLMVPFIERGLAITDPKGDLIYIVSNAICTSKYALKLLDLIQENYFPRSIDYFEEMEVFEAGVIPVVLHIGRTNLGGQYKTSKIIHHGHFENIVSKTEIPTEEFKTLGRDMFRKEYSPFVLKNKPLELGDVCYISYGLRPNSDERYWKGEFTAKDLISEKRDKLYSKPYIEGKDLSNYLINRVRYLEWDSERVPKKLVRPTFPELYNRPKIMRGILTGGVFDETGIICNHSIVVFARFTNLCGVNNKSIQTSIKKFNRLSRPQLEKISEKFDLKYLLAVLNSSFALKFLNNIRRHRLENYFYPDDFRKLPIAGISLKEQKPFIDLVDQILALTGAGDYLSNAAAQAQVKEYERQIDQLIYELYGLTAEEIKIIEN